MIVNDSSVENQFNPMMDACKEMNSICKPLQKLLKIPYFTYTTLDLDLNFLRLSNNRSFFEELIFNNSIQEYHRYNLISFAKPGNYFLDTAEALEKYPILHKLRDACNEMGYGNFLLMTSYDEMSQRLSYYIFGGYVDKPEVLNTYMNYLPQLKQFCNYFEVETEKQRNTIHWSNIMNHMAPEILSQADLNNESLRLKTAFSSSLNSRNPTVSDAIKLTKRQKTMIEWFIRGKTADETATILNISRRTVESHFERIRTKLKCYSKNQVAQKVLELDLLS